MKFIYRRANSIGGPATTSGDAMIYLDMEDERAPTEVARVYTNQDRVPWPADEIGMEIAAALNKRFAGA